MMKTKTTIKYTLTIIAALFALLCLPQSVHAASVTGVASTVSTDANAGCGDTDWGTATAANLNSDNTGYATITGNTWDNNQPTYRISLSNFGIAITNGDSVDGIVVDMLGWNVAAGGAVDQLVQLTKVAGTEVGSNYAKTTTNWPTADPGTTYRNYGGSTDLWGTTWSEANVESTGFGLSVCLLAKAANQTFNMDHIRITVYHSTHTTTLSGGTNPGDSSIGPGGSITSVNGATLTTNAGVDPITSITVNLSDNSGVGTLTITDGSDTVLGSIGGGTGAGISTGSNAISITSTDATTGGTAFKVKVTPLSQSGMPAVPGGTYSITAPITDWTGTNGKAGQASDTSSTVTIDNASPNGATSTGGSAGDTQNTFNWTTSSSGDFNSTNGSVVYRWAAASAGSEHPAEGATPTVGAIDSTATVACVVSSSGSTLVTRTDGDSEADCTTAALTNGQAYTYKVFQKDTNGNYDAGVSIGTFTPVASGPPSCSSQASANWSAVGTWTAGCSGGNGQPIAGDVATISAGNNVTVDGAQAALTVTVNNTGTLSFGSSSSLTLGGTSGTIFTNNGSISAGSSSTVLFTGATAPTAILGGTSNFTGSNAFYNLTLSPTITGSVGYTMGAAFTVTNNFTMDTTSTGSNTLTATLSGTTIVGGLTDLKGETSGLSLLNTGSDQAFTTGSINIEAGGTFTANNSTVTINGTSGPLFTRTGTFNAGGSTVNFSETSADLTLTSGTVTFNTLQINMSGRTGSLGNTISVGSDLTITAGTLNDGGYQITGNGTGTLSVASGATLKLGASSATTFPTSYTNITLTSGSTVEYSSTSAQNVYNTPTYSNLTVSGASTKTLQGTTTVGGTLTISSGTLSTSGSNYNMSVGGNFTNNSTFSGGTSTISFNGTTTQAINGSSTTTFGSITDSNTSASVIPSVNFAVNGTLTINGSANFSPSAGTATFNNGSSISNSGTLVFYGLAIAGSATVSTSSSFSIANSLDVGASGNFSPSGSSTITFTGGTISNSGTLALVNVSVTGTVTTSASFSVSGNWSNSSSFTASAGTITLNGANSSTQAISGNSTFYNLSASTAGNTATRTIQYASGSTTTVSGTWTMNGTASYTLSLTPSSTTNWTISPTAASVDYVYLSRSTNTVGTICATHSTGDAFNTGYTITTNATCTNSAPNIPSLDSPGNGVSGQSITPALLTTDSDDDGDYLQYKIILCEDAGMSVNCQTFEQSANQTGWSGQNANGGLAYTSTTQATYTIQSALAYNKAYYWKSQAKDPAGSNSYGSTQVTQYSFTTELDPSPTPTPPPGAYFNFDGGINMEGVNIN